MTVLLCVYGVGALLMLGFLVLTYRLMSPMERSLYALKYGPNHPERAVVASVAWPLVLAILLSNWATSLVRRAMG